MTRGEDRQAPVDKIILICVVTLAIVAIFCFVGAIVVGVQQNNCLEKIADNYCKNTGYYFAVYEFNNKEFNCIHEDSREISAPKVYTKSEINHCQWIGYK